MSNNAIDTSKKRISLISLGCSKNLVDSEFLIGGLKNEDFIMTDYPEESDIVIVNTCGFLDKSREEGVDTILELGELKNDNVIEKIVVMGCFSERFPKELKKELPEVDEFFGTNDHKEIISFLTGKDFSREDPDYFRTLLTPNHYAYLKIAEGCDNGCAFCSIPLMRGLQRSQPVQWNLQEANRLAKQGIEELLVIAQDSTSYGWDLSPKSSLHELMLELDKVDGLKWIRLHYAHPAHLHRDMIDAFKTFKKIIPYIDMPVQHGSDRMLKMMRRGLKSDGIKQRISMLREACPDIAIRTSIIVGFPGEEEEDFNELIDFIKEVKFDRLGVFTYSDEEGTYAAENLEDNIPDKVKQQRYDQIMMIQQQISLEKNKALIGAKDVIVIDKSSEDEGWSIGRSYRDAPEIDNYVRINEYVTEGEFINIEYVDAFEYDLLAKRV